MEAFDRTICADLAGRKSEDGDWFFHRGNAIDWALVRRDRNTQIMTAKEHTMQNSMMNDVKRITFGRRLYETSRGFIGIGPAAAKIGDQVCVLLGGQVLYVLRPHNDRPNRYRFIGECHVHGMMDGKAVQDEVYSCREIILE